MRRFAFATGCALSLLLASPSAFADARAKARRHFAEALRLLSENEVEAAIREFEQAQEALPHPDVVYNLAKANETAGHTEDAIRWLRVYLEQQPPPPDADKVKADIDRLKALLPPPPTITPVELPVPEPPKKLPAKDLDTLGRIADDLRGIAPSRAAEIEDVMSRLEGTTEPPRTVTRPDPPEPKPRAKTKPPESPPVSKERSEVRDANAYEEPRVVTAATRKSTKPQDTPAAAWVMTAREIERRGYESVAEALRSVAGLHVLDDHVFVDIGVRGIHAGLRGQSRIIRVLIDGQPVAFRPTSGNFLGPELIPIRAVERIELIKGPASALYGANAFLGVLQIVTKKGGDLRGAQLGARTEISPGRTNSGVSVAGDFVAGTESGRISLLASGHTGSLDRSGLRVPESSPLFERLVLDRGGLSQNDLAKPLSLFGSLTYDAGKLGRLGLRAGFSRLDSAAEWLDVGALTHDTRINLENTWVRLDYEVTLGAKLGIGAFASYSRGAPGNDHRLHPLRIGASAPDASNHLESDFSSDAFFGGAEVRYDANDALSFRVGMDVDLDSELPEVTSVVFDLPVGVRRPGETSPVTPNAPRQRFDNVGAFLQVSANPTTAVDLIGGLRFDYHDIYRASVNGRVGSVFRLGDFAFAKLLYGSSFRVPAPDQLIHEEAYTGDTIGCQNYAPCDRVGLEPQRAHTAEVVLGTVHGDRLTAQLTGFLSFVNDLIISFPNTGELFVTTNAGSYRSYGAELEVTSNIVESRGLDLSAHAQFSVESTDSDIPTSQFDPPEAIRPEFRESSLYPPLSGSVGFDLAFPRAYVGIYVEGRFIGPRRASGSNLALSSAGYDADGRIPGGAAFDVTVSTRDLLLLGERKSTLTFQVSNVFDALEAEGGHRGWDIPNLGRRLSLRWLQEL